MAHPTGAGDDPLDSVARRIAGPVAELTELWARGAAVTGPRLSAHQLRALAIVGRAEGVNLTGLAESAGMALPSASRLCDRLEAAGWLERTAAAGNRREVELVLTAVGRELLDDVAAQRHRDLVAVLRGMPPEQVLALGEGLSAFHRACPGAGIRHGRAS
jgi:DNA-binding MarR family transcriptional regulator